MLVLIAVRCDYRAEFMGRRRRTMSLSSCWKSAFGHDYNTDTSRPINRSLIHLNFLFIYCNIWNSMLYCSCHWRCTIVFWCN